MSRRHTRGARPRPRAPRPTPPRGPSRRTLQLLLVFIGAVLTANAVVGERGLLATRTARQAADRLADEIERLRADNTRLADESERLRTDPAAVEAVARGELGLIRRGEILILLHDDDDDGPGPARARQPR